MDYIITDAAAEKLGRIVEIESASFSDPWPEVVFRTQLASDRCVFLTAEAQGETAGYLCMMYILDEAELANIAVAPEHRRRGVAEALLDEAERRCGELGLKTINLEVRQGNAPAMALYEKRGFQVVGQRRDYYEKPREDAVLMTLVLG